MSTGQGSESGYHFMQDFRNCQVYWMNRHYRGLLPMHDAPHNLYGTAMHKGLEERYRAMIEGEPTHLAIKRFKNKFESEMIKVQDRYYSPETWARDLQKGQFVIEQYGLRYPNEQDKVICLEQNLSYMLPNGFTITGTVDMVIDRPGYGIRIVDHKNTGWSLNNLKRTLSVSGQATCYLLLWNESHPDQKTYTVIFNILRYYNGSTDFDRHIVMKTQGDIDQFVEEAAATFEDINDKVHDPEPKWIHNFDNCFSYNRPCPYLELCQGENYQGLIGLKYRWRDDANSHEQHGSVVLR